MQLANETKRIIEALPDEGLRRVIAAPNETFTPGRIRADGGRGCLVGVAFDFDAGRGYRFVCDNRLCEGPGFDAPFVRAESDGQRDTFLNAIKAYCVLVLETRADALRGAVERDLASVTVVESEPRGAVVGERVEA